MAAHPHEKSPAFAASAGAADPVRRGTAGDPNITLVVGAIAILDGQVDIEALRGLANTRAPERPGLNGAASDEPPRATDEARRRVADVPEEHVRRASLAPPGRRAELAAAVAEVWSRPLAPGDAAWDATLFEGLADGRTAVLVRARRGVVDDQGGVELLAQLFGSRPAGADFPSLRLRATPPRPTTGAARPVGALASFVDLAAAGARAAARVVGRELSTLLDPSEALVRARAFAAKLESASLILASPGPETPFNGAVGRGRRIGQVRLSRDVLHGLEEALDAPVEEIVPTIVAGALGRYLETRGRATAALDLVAIVKNGRPNASDAGGLVALPVGAMAPGDRHAAIRATLRDPQSRAGLSSLETLASLCLSLPAPLRPAASSLVHQAVNVVCVRARAPRGGIEIAGRRALVVVPIAPLLWHVGLTFAWVDLGDGALTIGVNADTLLVPDLAPLEEALHEAYVEAAAWAGVPAILPPE